MNCEPLKHLYTPAFTAAIYVPIKKEKMWNALTGRIGIHSTHMAISRRV